LLEFAACLRGCQSTLCTCSKLHRHGPNPPNTKPPQPCRPGRSGCRLSRAHGAYHHWGQTWQIGAADRQRRKGPLPNANRTSLNAGPLLPQSPLGSYRLGHPSPSPGRCRQNQVTSPSLLRRLRFSTSPPQAGQVAIVGASGPASTSWSSTIAFRIDPPPQQGCAYIIADGGRGSVTKALQTRSARQERSRRAGQQNLSLAVPGQRSHQSKTETTPIVSDRGGRFAGGTHGHFSALPRHDVLGQ
jgi:hypothetical protein